MFAKGNFQTMTHSQANQHLILINEESKTIVGYMAYFELTNGFRKAFYMTKEQLEKHGKKYSQSYKKNFGVWKDNFDAMAKKTVLKMLLSKFAPLSTQMEQALIDDQKVADDYADNKISFQVEGATVGDEPIDAQPSEDDYLDEPVEAEAVEVPTNLEEFSDAPFEDEPDLITEKQLKMLLAITNKLPEDLQAKEAQARELNYPGRSRKTFTKQEASHHIKYVQSLEESVQNA
jgi:recombinational DNA repair protein RecT